MGLLLEGARLVVDDIRRRLVAEAPGQAHAVFNVLQETLARLERRVVIERRPDLLAHLLRETDTGDGPASYR